VMDTVTRRFDNFNFLATFRLVFSVDLSWVVINEATVIFFPNVVYRENLLAIFHHYSSGVWLFIHGFLMNILFVFYPGVFDADFMTYPGTFNYIFINLFCVFIFSLTLVLFFLILKWIICAPARSAR